MDLKALHGHEHSATRQTHSGQLKTSLRLKLISSSENLFLKDRLKASQLTKR